MDLSLTTLGLSLLAGSLTTLSPCVFPVLPLVLGGAVRGNRWAPLWMGLGMALSFALVGMLLGVIGPSLGLDSAHVRTAGALVLIAMGLTMWVPAWNARLTHWMQPLASSAHNASRSLDGGTWWSALMLGGVLGLVWSPCSGPLLASALTLVASEGGVARGGLVLGFFGLGAATPLVAVAYASRKGFQSAQGWILVRIDQVKKGFAALIILTGLAILTGVDKWLEAQVVQRMPDVWLHLTTLF
jgi:cytochrome c biogenesis protein CcdA